MLSILSGLSSQRIAAIVDKSFKDSERASFVIALMSSFPVQILGIESLSWLKTVMNLSFMRIKIFPASSLAFFSTTLLA
nr:hypothetical protein Iba_chr06bCG14180 [Ipomoea batatas]